MLVLPEIARPYADWRDELRARTSHRLREPSLADPADAVPEIEVQARWFAGEFGRHFTSPDGESVEILQFGHWNRGAGPDFTEAAVRIDGQVRTGAIEVDLAPGSWEGHGHGANPAFDAVVLHVFLEPTSPRGPRFFTRDSHHRRVTQLTLPRSALLPSTSPRRPLPEAHRGRCAAPLAGMTDPEIESLLLAAARYRLERKSRRIAAIAEAHSEAQALFLGLAEALGYRHNRVSMTILGQRLPLAELRSEPDPATREARLFGVAGFLDPTHYRSAADEAARDYLASLRTHWGKARQDRDHESDGRRLRWKLAGTRPTNHPQRRIAALAAIAGDWPGLRRRFLDRPENPGTWIDSLAGFLVRRRHGFWNYHYTLKAQRTAAPIALIGPDRSRDLLANVLLPARLPTDARLWEPYLEIRGSAISEPLRRAGLRLFGHQAGHLTPPARRWMRRYWHQQALLQVYSDFCLEDASECADCPFPEQLLQWRS